MPTAAELRKIMREKNIFGSSYMNNPEMIRILKECNLLPDFQEKSENKQKSHTARSVEVINLETNTSTTYPSIYVYRKL